MEDDFPDLRSASQKMFNSPNVGKSSHGDVSSSHMEQSAHYQHKQNPEPYGRGHHHGKNPDENVGVNIPKPTDMSQHMRHREDNQRSHPQHATAEQRENSRFNDHRNYPSRAESKPSQERFTGDRDATRRDQRQNQPSNYRNPPYMSQAGDDGRLQTNTVPTVNGADQKFVSGESSSRRAAPTSHDGRQQRSQNITSRYDRQPKNVSSGDGSNSQVPYKGDQQNAIVTQMERPRERQDHAHHTNQRQPVNQAQFANQQSQQPHRGNTRPAPTTDQRPAVNHHEPPKNYQQPPQSYQQPPGSYQQRPPEIQSQPTTSDKHVGARDHPQAPPRGKHSKQAVQKYNNTSSTSNRPANQAPHGNEQRPHASQQPYAANHRQNPVHRDVLPQQRNADSSSTSRSPPARGYERQSSAAEIHARREGPQGVWQSTGRYADTGRGHQPSSTGHKQAHADAGRGHQPSSTSHKQARDARPSQGFSNRAYTSDEQHQQHQRPHQSRSDVRYDAKYDARSQSTDVRPGTISDQGRHNMQSKAQHDPIQNKYSSTTAINMTSQPSDPLQNQYALPANTQTPAGASGIAKTGPTKYSSMSALHVTSTTAAPELATQQRPRAADTSAGGYHGTAAASGVDGLPSYADAMKAPATLNAGQLMDGQSAAGADRRRFQKRRPTPGQTSQTQQQPPRATRRGRILSQHQEQQQPQQLGQHDAQFNSAPPMRAQSVSDIRVSLNTDPGLQNGTGQITNLHRPQSVPNINGAVQSQNLRASTTSLNQNGNSVSNGHGPGLWRSKSLLELAIESQGSNLQRSTSVTSLVLANPRLARTISTYQLYENDVKGGRVPSDHQTTLILSIVATGLFPFTGIPVLVFTMLNRPVWFECIQEAATTNNRLFWGAVGSIVLGVVLWITLIVLLSLNYGS